MAIKSEWLCIECGIPLGKLIGGELYPISAVIHTSGPNLVVTCPTCGFVKTWYTSDPVTRAVYQLLDAVASEAAGSMARSLAKTIHAE